MSPVVGTGRILWTSGGHGLSVTSLCTGVRACRQHVASSTLWDPRFLWKAHHPPPPRQGRVAPSQAGQPSRDTPGALVCQRRAPPSPSVHLRPSPPVLEQSLPHALQWHASLLGCRPSTIRGPDERLAPARLPAVARGFRAGSPDGSVGRTCRQPAAPRSACGDPVLLKPREPATQGSRGRLCWLVPHSCGR